MMNRCGKRGGGRRLAASCNLTLALVKTSFNQTRHAAAQTELTRTHKDPTGKTNARVCTINSFYSINSNHAAHNFISLLSINGLDKQTLFICPRDSAEVHLHNYMLVLNFMFA